jgi:hypothetical protein
VGAVDVQACRSSFAAVWGVGEKKANSRQLTADS